MNDEICISCHANEHIFQTIKAQRLPPSHRWVQLISLCNETPGFDFHSVTLSTRSLAPYPAIVWTCQVVQTLQNFQQIPSLQTASLTLYAYLYSSHTLINLRLEFLRDQKPNHLNVISWVCTVQGERFNYALWEHTLAKIRKEQRGCNYSTRVFLAPVFPVVETAPQVYFSKSWRLLIKRVKPLTHKGWRRRMCSKGALHI